MGEGRAFQPEKSVGLLPLLCEEEMSKGAICPPTGCKELAYTVLTDMNPFIPRAYLNTTELHHG